MSKRSIKRIFPTSKYYLNESVPLCIYRVSTEYLHSIRQYVSTTSHRHTTRAQTPTPPPHNCWKLSSVPSLPRRASVHKQRRSCLRKTSGMCPELINILGNAIVKYLQYVVKHRAFWQKQFKARLG